MLHWNIMYSKLYFIFLFIHCKFQKCCRFFTTVDLAPSDECPQEPRYRHCSTMTEPARPKDEPAAVSSPTEVLAETIDLSSETASSVESSVGGGGWKPVLPVAAPSSNSKAKPPLIKYTYFGYETYARPTSDQHVPQQRILSDKQQQIPNGKQSMALSKNRTATTGGE